MKKQRLNFDPTGDQDTSILNVIGKRKPAWTDSSMTKIAKSKNKGEKATVDKGMTIDIENGPSRLRKLKKSENEKTIDGFQYEQRLKEQYSKIIGKSDVFSWADRSKKEDIIQTG